MIALKQLLNRASAPTKESLGMGMTRLGFIVEGASKGCV